MKRIRNGENQAQQLEKYGKLITLVSVQAAAGESRPIARASPTLIPRAHHKESFFRRAMPIQFTKKAIKAYLHGFLPRTIAYGESFIPLKWRAQCWSWLGCYAKALKIYLESAAGSTAVDLRLLAACGMTNELKGRLQLLDRRAEKKKAALAIMAFAPDLACELFSETGPCIPFAAALATLGRYSESSEILKTSPHHASGDSNIGLLEANCGLLDPLDAINRCLAKNDLTKLSRIKGRKGALSFSAERPRGQRGGPRATIIVASYNTRESIQDSVLSLLNQTWENIEIIAVDDSSTDDSAEILNRMSDRDRRLRVVCNTNNQGPYAARMKAIELSTGEFITCHDSDDWAHPEKIERQLKPMLQDPRIVATTSSWVRIDTNEKFYTRKSWPLIHHNPASLLFRKDAVLATIGGFDLVRAGADSEFYERLKLAFGNKRVKQIDGILTLGSHRVSSITNCKETGVIDFKPSYSRIAYWEAWRHWHIECIRKGIPIKMPSYNARPFTAPEEILIKPSPRSREDKHHSPS